MASAIGLSGYCVSGEGIGGMNKTRVSDFRVEEITRTISFDPRGRFTVAKITLTNWETNRFVKRLAKTLKMSRERIWFAGTKDKRAVTRQLFVIDSPTNKVAAVEIPDVEIEILGRSHQKLGFGAHRGNRFTIVIRGCADSNGNPMSPDEAIAQIEQIRSKLSDSLGEGNFPNWIGPQRFGSARPVTAAVGREIISGNYQQAVDTYLGMEGIGEGEEVSAFRKAAREAKAVDELLEIIPTRLGYEREMLSHLAKRPDDYVGAFLALPRNLQLMTIHALQSEAFNRYTLARIEAELPLASPVLGDYVAPLNEKGSADLDRKIQVDERTLPRISRNCQKGRLAVLGFLPGSQTELAGGQPGEVEANVLEEMGLKDCDWRVERIRRLTSKGSNRPLVSTFSDFIIDTVPIASDETLSERWKTGPQEGDRWHPEGACVRFRFTLPPGSYATVFLREFMRCPIHQL